ncbi:hypothetical protein [Microbacterium sp. Root180]|uniref:hypothetical protein n=1 Tax=Microbacterium sp. Root180 TaxID=1736483 RepID=UPI0006FCD6D3|nr:hypothetical protein [Microbacterium sp. Root180]KRB38818.1 hypothetical protein ASD93_02440 [Microbacterium sp. Root180]
MIADEFALAPIRHPNHPNRDRPVAVCRMCSREFRPWSGAVGLYCTVQCAGRAKVVEPAPPLPEEVAMREDVVDQCRAALAELNEHMAGRGVGT